MFRKNTLIILFNYGGGMRGLIPARIMAKIEEATGRRMASMVDVFSGPSTGSILNAALNIPHPKHPNSPRFKAEHMVEFYKREGLNIFPSDRFRDFRAFIHDFNNRTMKIDQLQSLFRHGHYDPAHLLKCLKDLYGERTLSDTLSNIVVPVYNIDGELNTGHKEHNGLDYPTNNFIDGGGHAVWFKNMHRGVKNPYRSQAKMHDVILASCAAPTFFPSHHFEADAQEFTGIDGSIFDNPCTTYFGAIRPHIPKNTEVIMIALGTGFSLRSFKKEDWNSFGGLGVVDPVNDLPLINILFHAPESALVQSFSDELRDNLFVFNKSLVHAAADTAPSHAIDDGSPQNMENMERFADAIIEENRPAFDQVCKILADNTAGKKRGGIFSMAS